MKREPKMIDKLLNGEFVPARSNKECILSAASLQLSQLDGVTQLLGLSKGNRDKDAGLNEFNARASLVSSSCCSELAGSLLEIRKLAFQKLLNLQGIFIIALQPRVIDYSSHQGQKCSEWRS